MFDIKVIAFATTSKKKYNFITFQIFGILTKIFNV